jgi:hypothetical protein
MSTFGTRQLGSTEQRCRIDGDFYGFDDERLQSELQAIKLLSKVSWAILSKTTFEDVLKKITQNFGDLDKWLEQARTWRGVEPEEREELEGNVDHEGHPENPFNLRYRWQGRCSQCAAVLLLEFDGVWRVYGTATDGPTGHQYTRGSHEVTRDPIENASEGEVVHTETHGLDHTFCLNLT